MKSLHILGLRISKGEKLVMGADLNQMFDGFPSRDEDDVELRQSSSSDSDEESPLSDFREEEATSPGSPPPLAKTTCLPPKFDAKGPLDELSSLMAQLPFKRGLSKYYQGKSQSYSSLSDVRCLADLPKKETPYRRKMKSCKSYAGGLDGSPESNLDPGTSSKTISKKASGGSCASSIARSRSKPPPISVPKNLCLH
ncbi:uncharacterized protein [Elaeis guineensis]|uniref:Uncharacterized protein LOC105040180 n=1 Tax=Elaeis guineensis var. tenera TaxID=51953 RepID=A0A6I9QTQ6_ELAGV|nr:uncharacterized protein LOC105040180 [Elaeis guineensis]